MDGVFEFGFGVLLEAMENEREKVRDIVKADRSILEATNRTGENVLRWYALENRFEEVSMLRSLGSSIQSVTITEAIEMGNTEMVGHLLELGGEPDLTSCRMALESEFSELTSRQKHIISGHLQDYGYEI